MPDLREALRRLQQACSDVQRAAEESLSALEAQVAAPASPPPLLPVLPSPAPAAAVPPAPAPASPAAGTTSGRDTPPAPAAASPAADPLSKELRSLHDQAVAAGVDAADVAPLLPAAGAPDPRECGRAIYRLLWRYFFLLPDDLRRAAREAVRTLAERAGIALPSEETRVPSTAPAGSLVAELTPGRKLLSGGRASPAAQAFEAAARTGAAARVESAAVRAAALDELMKLWPQLADADAAKDLTVLRYAVNALHPLGVPRALEPLLAALRQAGIQEMIVDEGVTFDDSYSPNRYERRRVKSSAPRNAVVKVLQRGFVGPDGVPLQKAVVGVSDGGS